MLCFSTYSMVQDLIWILHYMSIIDFINFLCDILTKIIFQTPLLNSEAFIAFCLIISIINSTFLSLILHITQLQNLAKNIRGPSLSFQKNNKNTEQSLSDSGHKPQWLQSFQSNPSLWIFVVLWQPHDLTFHSLGLLLFPLHNTTPQITWHLFTDY